MDADREVPQWTNLRIDESQGYTKRAYKACLACRRSKVKCEIGSGPACVRCTREMRECLFPQERAIRKRKIPTRSKPRVGPSYVALGVPDHPAQAQELQQSQSQNTLPHLTQTDLDAASAGLRSVDNDLDEQIMRTAVSSNKDAMNLLFNVAEQSDSDELDGQPRLTGEFNGYDVPTTISGLKACPCFNLSNPSQDILECWKPHRFVRQGWFSAREAVTYIDLFFEKLAPMSPVAGLLHLDAEFHNHLVQTDPLLCCVLLTISSRYHVLSGQCGQSRTIFIHSRLWKHCEHLIQRITFGSEKISTGKTRTLSSIYALLLITEWHARDTYFPPETDGWDAGLASSFDDPLCDQDRAGTDSECISRWREEVFEPAKRADRMSWMLVGIAISLAHELGVFRPLESDREIASKPQSTEMTRHHLQRLLFLYVNQLSLRIGCSSVVQLYTPQSFAFAYPPTSNTFDLRLQDQQALLSKWIEIMKLLKSASDMIFSDSTALKQAVRTGRYIGVIDHFQPLLQQWYNEFKALELSTVSEPAKQALLIEYHYVRMYINSLAVQALVERANVSSPPETWAYDAQNVEHREDFKRIAAVRDASCQILRAASKLAEDDDLKYCPIRIYLRIVAASIFLLKAITIGATTSDIQNSLQILSRCIHGLQSHREDDIHLSTRFAILIARHVRRLQKRLRVQSKPGQNVADMPPASAASNIYRDTEELIPDVDFYNNTQFDFDCGTNMETWMALPFDLSMAPFGWYSTQLPGDVEVNSLDFLWRSN